MTRIFARPAEGIVLPLADGSSWPAEGTEVELDAYVRRRLADGDVIEISPPPQAKSRSEAATASGTPATAKLKD